MSDLLKAGIAAIVLTVVFGVCIVGGIVSKPVGLYVESWSFRNSHQRQMSQVEEIYVLLDEHAVLEDDIERLGRDSPRARTLRAQQTIIADRIRRAAANSPRSELPAQSLRFLGEQP